MRLCSSFLCLLLLTSAGARANDVASIDALFDQPSIERRGEPLFYSRVGQPVHRVLLRLPKLPTATWAEYRQGLRGRIEALLRREGYGEIAVRELAIDAESSTLQVLGVRPASMAQTKQPAKRIHLLANRAVTGECYISYEVRMQ